jgi:hypothetical protein
MKKSKSFLGKRAGTPDPLAASYYSAKVAPEAEALIKINPCGNGKDYRKERLPYPAGPEYRTPQARKQ